MKTIAAALSCLVLVSALSACGNKGPLVMPPPDAGDATLEEAAAVDNAGAVADPTPADDDAGVTPFPPQAEPQRTPEATPPADADADPTSDGDDAPEPPGNDR